MSYIHADGCKRDAKQDLPHTNLGTRLLQCMLSLHKHKLTFKLAWNTLLADEDFSLVLQGVVAFNGSLLFLLQFVMSCYV
jgi:hypothetical protein